MIFLVFKHLNVSIFFAEKDVFFNAVFYCLYQPGLSKISDLLNPYSALLN